MSNRQYLIATRINNRGATAAVVFEDDLINDCARSQWYHDNHVPADEVFVIIPAPTLDIVREYVDYDTAWSRLIEVPFDLPERAVLEAIIDQVPVEGIGAAEKALARSYGDRFAYGLDDLYDNGEEN